MIDLDFSLHGKKAVVTGGGSGIGAAIAAVFAAKGATVIVADRDTSAAQGVVDGLVGADHQQLACDVADADSVAALSDRVAALFGRPDIVVNSAGVARLAPAEDLGLDAWDATLNINLRGTFLVCQSLGRLMLDHPNGTIINLASQAGTVAIEERVAYCASKFGVIGLTKVLATEWGGRGVRVNTISPTVVLTDLGRMAWAGEKGEAAKKLIPVGRFAEPDEIAAAALFLASDNSAMINGADLVVDGGYTIS